MRQRRVSGIEDKLAEYAELVLQPEAGAAAVQLLQNGRPVRWYQRTSERYILPEGFLGLYAELGCGRGLFINTLAEADPESLYIGVEGCKTIIHKAMARTRKDGLANVRYIDAFINDFAGAFSENSLDGLFLNFSDPWPKDRHAERRLTAPAKAKSYLCVLKPGGFVALKTDGEAFFDYSQKSFEEAGFIIESAARDLPLAASDKGRDKGRRYSDRDKEGGSFCLENDPHFGQSVPTEYELRFRALGQPIYHFIAKKPERNEGSKTKA